MSKEMKIPFHKPCFDNKEQEAVCLAIKRNMVNLGPIVSAFEKEFANYIGASYAVAVNSCSSALHLAVVGLGIGAGDEIITTPLTFSSTLFAILYAKASPVLADIDPVTFCIDPESIRSKITKKTKAILIVHHSGNPCNMDAVISICKEHNLMLIEDAAHALPTRWNGNLIGIDRKDIKNVVCFSFQATKTLAIGDGGMLVTWDKELADVFRIKRLFGMKRHDELGREIDIALQYGVEMEGYKYNMTDIEAAIGRVQLKKLDMMYKMRKNIAMRYLEGLKDIKQIVIPQLQEGIECSWHLFVIRLLTEGKRDEMRSFLAEHGISTSIHFVPLYRFPYFKKLLGYPFQKDSNIEKIADNIISIPIYPTMEDNECDYVISAIKEFFES